MDGPKVEEQQCGKGGSIKMGALAWMRGIRSIHSLE